LLGPAVNGMGDKGLGIRLRYGLQLRSPLQRLKETKGYKQNSHHTKG